MKVSYSSKTKTLFINVDWREFPSVVDMIDTVDDAIPHPEVVGDTLYIKGKFPYQLGMFLIIKYYSVENIYVYDPQQQEFYRYKK